MRIAWILAWRAWDELVARLSDIGDGVAGGALSLLLAVAVALAGWALAVLAARLVTAVLRAARFNVAAGRVFGETAVRRHEPAALAGWASYWAVMVTTVLLAFDTLGLHLSAAVGDRLAEVAPRIVTSTVLLVAGVLIAMLLGALTRQLFETAGLRGARLRGQVVTAILSGFAVLLALEQLGFAAQFIMALGVVALAAVGLGSALAFGLGCRDLARDFVVEYLRSLDEEGPKRPS
jgi:hypothetical protein